MSTIVSKPKILVSINQVRLTEALNRLVDKIMFLSLSKKNLAEALKTLHKMEDLSYR